jgi:hypothetical protein
VEAVAVVVSVVRHPGVLPRNQVPLTADMVSMVETEKVTLVAVPVVVVPVVSETLLVEPELVGRVALTQHS